MNGAVPSCWDDAERHEPSELFWLSDPLVRAAVNRRVSGDASVWPIPWFRNRVADRLPFERVLSVGCGTGALERNLVQEGIASRVVGVDLAMGPLSRARQTARRSEVADRVLYVQARAEDLLTKGHWDAVFFHGSLHHFEDVAGTLERVARSLKPRGVLYLDEYVGRSRGDWRPWHLLLPNLVYRTLPASVRRTHVVRSPVTDEDPTEQVRAADILPSVKRSFRLFERKDYGGNLLLLIYPSLRRPGPGGSDRAIFDGAVARLVALEDAMLRHPRWVPEGSMHAVLWAEPRPGP